MGNVAAQEGRIGMATLHFSLHVSLHGLLTIFSFGHKIRHNNFS
jgi:hypothetical protein